MKKMIATGDSFTYGLELDNVSNAWPCLVAKELGLDLTNLGTPGASNFKITRLLMEQDITDVALVCIGWSHYDRIEIADEIGVFDSWPGGYRTKNRQEAPWRAQIIDYFSRHHNDDFLYTNYLINIILVQSWLEKNNIQYVMMDSFGNHTDPRRFDSKFQILLDQVNPLNFLGWPTESMTEWTKEFPCGPGNHFLEDGHRVVAGKVLERLSLLGI